MDASEIADNDSPASITTTNETNVPDQNMPIKQEQSPKDSKTVKSTSQAMPMNLTNEHGKVKSEMDGLDYGQGAESMDVPDYSDTVCKIGKSPMHHEIFL